MLQLEVLIKFCIVLMKVSYQYPIVNIRNYCSTTQSLNSKCIIFLKIFLQILSVIVGFTEGEVYFEKKKITYHEVPSHVYTYHNSEDDVYQEQSNRNYNLVLYIESPGIKKIFRLDKNLIFFKIKMGMKLFC